MFKETYPCLVLKDNYILNVPLAKRLLRITKDKKFFLDREHLIVSELYPDLLQEKGFILQAICSLPRVSDRPGYPSFSCMGYGRSPLTHTQREICLQVLLGERDYQQIDGHVNLFRQISNSFMYFDGCKIRGHFQRCWNSTSTLNLLLAWFKTNSSLPLARKTAQHHEDLLKSLMLSSELIMKHLLQEK